MRNLTKKEIEAVEKAGYAYMTVDPESAEGIRFKSLTTNDGHIILSKEPWRDRALDIDCLIKCGAVKVD